MNNKNIVVVVMDMQERFLLRVKDEMEPLIESQLDVLDLCSRVDLPVIVMGYVLENGEHEIIPDPLEKRLKTKIEKIPRTEYLHRYYAMDGETNDAFKYGCLKGTLESFNPTYVCFMGIGASACIKQTAESTSNAGYKILTAEPLIADEKKDIALSKSAEWYKKNGLFFTDHQSLIRYMGGLTNL